VGLPVGAELKASIASDLNIKFDMGSRLVTGSPEIVHALESLVTQGGRRGDINPLREVCVRISEAMPQAESIDNFIDCHRADPQIALCGKLAIALEILKAERRSKLYVDRRGQNNLDFAQVEKTWFTAFFQILAENCDVEQLAARLETIAIVSFNYDRCFEHYMWDAFKNYYGISGEVSRDILGRLNIYHPYGTVGNLPFLSSADSIDFGSTPTERQLIQAVNQLKTFTEGTDEHGSDIQAIRGAFGAGKVIFLGFAFHRQNLELLFPGTRPSAPLSTTRAYGTARGISRSDCEVIKDQLHGKAGFGAPITLRDDLTCAEFFADYRRTLSFA
jgi:hypothetical protein